MRAQYVSLFTDVMPESFLFWFYHEFNGELIKKMRYNSINQ